MNLKNSFLLLQFFSSMLFGFTFTDTGETENDTILQLMERVTLLELELDEMKRQSVRNPISSRAYKNWGEGLTIAVEYPYLSAELGYTFKIIKKQVRLGFSYGYAMRPDNFSGWPAEYSGLGKHNTYWKILVGSPVFFNLMSFSGSISQLYWFDRWTADTSYTAEYSNSDGGVWIGYESIGDVSTTVLSANAEFWVSPKVHIYFGINVNFNRFTPDYDHYIYYQNHPELITPRGLDSYDGEQWVTNHFKFGARYHFGTFRSMAQNAKKRKSKK